jgi:hypothetical protein
VSNRHLYLIEDGERHWVSGESPDDAVSEFLRVTECDPYELKDAKVTQIPDDQLVKVYQDEPFRDPTPFIEKPAWQWAAERYGMVASTSV